MRGGLKNYQNDFKFMICMFLTITKRYRYAPKKFEEKNFFLEPLTSRQVVSFKIGNIVNPKKLRV